ncbi:MAG: hypothetical protein WD669_04310 [Pirellulales bacterium]
MWKRIKFVTAGLFVGSWVLGLPWAVAQAQTTTTAQPTAAEQKQGDQQPGDQKSDSKAADSGATQTTAETGRGRRGGRRNDAPGMTPEARDAFVAVTSTNTYTPIDTKDADGNIVKHEPVGVSPITDEIYESYRLDRFYKKMIKINGILIVGSQRVSDYALLEAAYTKDQTFHNSPQWVRDMFEPLKIRLAIISVLEFTMDLPENNRNGRNSALADAVYQDGRSRGLGGLPTASCGEENLLNLRGDRYGGSGAQGSGENITIHEFAHTTASAIRRVQGNDGPFWTKLREALAASRFPGDENTPPGRIFAWNRDNGRNGQPGNVYGGSNEQEYWAEGAQAWFNNANPRNSGGISTREEVKAKDPPLAALLAEVYGDGDWRYIKTTATNPDGSPMRPAAELSHLAGIPRDKIPVFNNNNSPRVQAAAANPELVRGGRSGGRGGRRGARGAGADSAGGGARDGERAGGGEARGSGDGAAGGGTSTTPATGGSDRRSGGGF